MSALWYLWFSSSLAMPFFLGFAETAGTVAYTGSYGFAALGMLVGIWLSTCPTIRKYQVRSGDLPLFLLAPGLVITLVLWPTEIARFFLLEGANLPTWLFRANAAMAPMEKPLVFLNAMLCGLTSRNSTQGQGCTYCRREVPAVILGFVAGLTRGWAWTLLLPSPAFPLPATDYRLSVGDLWASSLSLPVGICLTFAFTLVWARLARKLQERYGADAFPHIIGALCLGELTWRFASRICPSLLQVSMACAIAALVAQVACPTATWAFIRTTPPIPPQGWDERGEDDTNSRMAIPLPAELSDMFSAHRLTEKETAVLTATLRGLTSAEAAAQLGISASTIRTYRARACDKLHVSGVAELMGNIGQHQKALKPVAALRPNSSLFMRSLPTAGSMAMLLLVLTPPPRTAACWECTWLIPFGIALGLMVRTAWLTLQGMWCKPRPMWPIGRSAPIRVVVVVIAVAALQCCYAMLAQGDPYTPQPTLLRACAVGAVAICTIAAAERIHNGCLAVQADDKNAPFAIAGAVVFATWGSLGEIWWHISMTVCAVLVCLGITAQNKEAKCGNPALHLTASPTAMLDVAALAFIWEETLRGMAYASLRYCGTIFLATSLCVVALRPFKNLLHDFPRGAAIALTLCAIILACTKGPFLSLLVTVTVLCPFAGIAEGEYQQTPPSSWHSPYEVTAFGLCAAVYTANAWGSSIANGNGNIAFIATLSVVLSLLGVPTLARAVRSCKQKSPRDAMPSTESLAAALQSYDLTPLQLNVALCVAQGRSIDQIAKELSYSRSRVHQVLKEVYATLNLHNHTQLKAFLAQASDNKASC